MKSFNFDAGESAYKQNNFVDALKSYYAALKSDSESFGQGDVGLLYYRIGNCLLKMHTFSEAAISYQKALTDDGFASKAAVYVNLGKTQLGLGKFEESVQSFKAALADTSYTKPYQAQMGLGNAYTKLGMIIDAGSAYRNAALDDRNPNPAKALISLGGCFMALGRPADAIESYNAVFEFDPTQKLAQKTYESLGQALVAAGYYPEAVEAFKRALAPGSYSLSAAADADYKRALLVVGANNEAAEDPLAGLNTFASTAVDPIYEPQVKADGTMAYGGGNVPAAAETGFFDATEQDLVQRSKELMRGQRKLRHTGLKITLVIVILLILVLGAGVFGYTQGYGWPMTDKVIEDLFEAHAAGTDTTQYWVGTTAEEKEAIERIMSSVARTTNITTEYSERSMLDAEAIVTARLSEGGALHYDIKLERDGIGWKISALTLYFASTQ